MTPARIGLAVALAIGVASAIGLRLADAGRPTDTAADPVETLAKHPLDGASFAQLAKAETDPDRRLELHALAARRAPRDLEVRAWLFEHHIAAGDPAAAIEHLDVILRLAPADMRKTLVPAVVQLAANPDFAGALADTLATGPGWRRAVLDGLRAQIAAPGSIQVLGDLNERGELTPVEAGRWLNALIRGGHWGMAYSLWASGLPRTPGESLPMLWDGGFDLDPTGYGFGWRIGRAPGSYVELQPTAGTEGRAARLVFLGRAVATANLEQPMHLPPGRYRIRMRLMGEALRSDRGLQWEVSCAGRGPRSRGEPVNGSFEWRDYAFDFNVPVTGCPGQWLRLRNPAPAGSARVVSGELWVDDVGLDQAERIE